MESCLAAVSSVHPGAVVAADFARYEGGPAVVLLVRGDNTSTVVAVGPGCGNGGADELAAVHAG
jgi:hypothetical protein